MQFGPHIYTVATSATQREIEEGTETGFFTRYDTAPAKLYSSFRDGRVRFDEYEDSFGRFRSIYMPVRSPDGRIHVIGADIALDRWTSGWRARCAPPSWSASRPSCCRWWSGRS
ncbi:hypothetical protein ACFSTI_17905 [Rhizorhabdus histidinilytica]